MSRTTRRLRVCRCSLQAVVLAAILSRGLAAEVRVSPAAVSLDLPDASSQLVVTAVSGDALVDRTHAAEYRSLDPSVAVVDARGVVLPRGDGTTRIVVSAGEAGRVEVPVRVRAFASPRPVSFRDDILPILTKAGCNSVACHAKNGGQNGFYLSFFGSDPTGDHEAIALASRARRVSFARPDASLLLLKATAAWPHGGGGKVETGSAWYRRLRRWISEGARFEVEGAPRLASIEVEPREAVLSPRGTQQLRVTAIDTDGGRRCVTVEAEYESNAPPIAGVDRSGRIDAGEVPGEAAILVRYMGQAVVCRVTIPRPGVRFERPPETNFVDALVWDKLELLGVRPSEPADDSAFLRRVFLDTTGTLPTPEEARAFLEDAAPDRRRRLVDDLLEREEYAVYHAMRWGDLLRVDTARLGAQTAVATMRWLRQQFRDNVPYDELVRAILTARGSTTAVGPAAALEALGGPKDAAGDLGARVSQLFLGVRIECAKCHQHPAEKWNPRDYYALGGFFTGISRKGSTIFPAAGKDLEDPGTGEAVAAAALGAGPADLDDSRDRREALADWITAPDNPFFARLIANRLWAHYFGRGLFEPVDDQRATNPATNEPLLDALAKHLRDLDYDLRAFTRTLVLSRVYGLSSVPNETNLHDRQSFSRAVYRPMPAEVLLDAISGATGVPESFNGWPIGYRAIEVWDNRMPSYFFEIFGRPKRLSVCECERGTEPSIAQALYLTNSPEVARKIRHRHGRARALATSGKQPGEIIEELFLATLSRFPTSAERELFLGLFESLDRRQATEDVLWTLLNTKRFIFVH